MSGPHSQRTDALPYRIRESKRARRVLLRVLAEGALEVVVPTGFNPKHVPEIVSAHAGWIQRTRAHLERTQLLARAEKLPEEVWFRATGARVSVRYVPAPSDGLRLTHASPTVIRIEGDAANVEGCRSRIRRCLRGQAKRLLIPWLSRASQETGLRYKLAQVRSQQSRWGSCSARGTISLNDKLLFLPPELVRYVLVHELCHTIHLSHSTAFWDLVRQFEPEFSTLNATLRKANRFIPTWAS